MTTLGAISDRYEVVRIISSGRTTVAQGRDLLHDRFVALKIYEVEGASTDDLLAETRTLMRLEPHPSLPTVRGDFFTADGTKYVVVTNWVDGVDVQTLIEEGGSIGLDPGESLLILEQVASGLDHLHRHQPPIVHGDVKPGNIIRSASGRVVLVDFDLAAAQQTGTRAGTVGYIAPEVTMGEPPQAASDIFGLAASAVTMLAGHPPANGQFTVASTSSSDIAALLQAAREGLAVDPSGRPLSAGAFVERLRHSRGSQLPSGTLAVLAVDVVVAADGHDIRRRAVDLASDIIRQHHGHLAGVAYSTALLGIFASIADAARAALRLQHIERPNGIGTETATRCRTALAAGPAVPAEGDGYRGTAVDSAMQLCSLAMVGTTMTTESTAELLIGMVGSELSIVPLGASASDSISGRPRLFALTASGDERAVDVAAEAVDEGQRALTERHPKHQRAIAMEILDHPAVAVALTAFGLALMFRFLVAPVIDAERLTDPIVAVLGVALGVTAGVVALRTIKQRADERVAERERRAAEDHATRAAADRLSRRRQLTAALASVPSGLARDAARVLASLGSEFEAIGETLRQLEAERTTELASTIPQLANDTYEHGVRAIDLSSELLRSPMSTNRLALGRELAELERRMATPDDHSDRRSDELRRQTFRRQLERDDAAQDRALELILEAERCSAALADARLELTAVIAGDAHQGVDRAVNALAETSQVVRGVRDEVRRFEP